jgi:hypothetical protein
VPCEDFGGIVIVLRGLSEGKGRRLRAEESGNRGFDQVQTSWEKEDEDRDISSKDSQ